MKNLKKVYTFFSLVIIILIVVSLPAGAMGISGKGKMRGLVLDEDTGQPLAAVTVKLYSQRAAAYFEPSPQTLEDGTWHAYFIQGGDWDIDFSKNGYEPKKITFRVDTRIGQKLPLIKISLKKTAAPVIDGSIANEIKLAAAAVEQGQYQEALVKFKEILVKSKEDNTINLVNKFIGNCYAGLKDYQQAIVYYRKALEKLPDDTSLLISIGSAYTNIGDNAAALEIFKKIPAAKIGDIDTLYNIGAIYYNNSDFSSAREYLEKAVTIDDTFADGYFLLGMTYTALNETEKAVVTLRKFIELAPGSPEVQTARAIVEAFSKG